ncbi:MAG: hypothetical protein Kow0098_12950 [Ignavibacteriaceae bacterium]
MSDFNWQELRKLFEKAILLTGDDRIKFVESECQDDLKLKEELLALLSAHDLAEGVLDHPLQAQKIISNFPGKSDNRIGQILGNYVIEGLAGEGGMGVVYSGRRNDKTFEQKVAIKILKLGIASDYLLKRFIVERKTLASLLHPNISRLIDGGNSPDGLPYLVMEFIEGTPLLKYCDNKKLTLKERLNLFVKICDAVHYAHRNLIVHRDIKPSNILITEQGIPKLLDFGIAKLLDQSQQFYNDGLTITGMWNLTPEYASPEQIKNEPITIASDIYSLGIMLYELLTGYHPYGNQRQPASITTLAKMFEKEFDKPSNSIRKNRKQLNNDKDRNYIFTEICLNRQISAHRLQQTLTGDLDNIILKAIQIDPDKRYASVEQFSTDINRYLNGLPVIAAGYSFTYRLSKFVKRHSAGVALTAIIFLVLLISGIIIIEQSGQVAEERDRARLSAQKFERINQFLQDMLSSPDPNIEGRDVKVYDVLMNASENLSSELKDQPELEAAVRSTIGITLQNLGIFDEAKFHLDSALVLYQTMYDSGSFEIAKAFKDLALYYHNVGNLNKSDSLYNKALPIFLNNKDYDKKVYVEFLNDYALLLTEFAQYEKAEVYLREAYSILNKDFDIYEPSYAAVLSNLAMVLHYQHKLDEAEKLYLRARDISLLVRGEIDPELGHSYNNLAFVYLDKGDFITTVKYFKKSLEIKRITMGEKHPDIGLALLNLGAIYVRTDSLDLAESYLSQALVQFNKTLDENHLWVANTYFWFGRLKLLTKNYNEGKKFLFKSLVIRQSNLPEKHPVIYNSKGELGICLLEQNLTEQSENYLTEAFEGCRENFGVDNFETQRFLEALLKLYKLKNDTTKLQFYSAYLQSTE